MHRKLGAIAGLLAVVVAVAPDLPPAAMAGLWSAPATLGEHRARARTTRSSATRRSTEARSSSAGRSGAGRCAPPCGARAGSVRGHRDARAGRRERPGGVALDGARRRHRRWSRDGALGLAERPASAPASPRHHRAVGDVQGRPDVAFVSRGARPSCGSVRRRRPRARAHQTGGRRRRAPETSPPGPGDVGRASTPRTWQAVAAGRNPRRTRATASRRGPGLGAPGGRWVRAPDEVARSVSTAAAIPSPGEQDREQLAAQRGDGSETGAADALIRGVAFQGQPGDVAL